MTDFLNGLADMLNGKAAYDPELHGLPREGYFCVPDKLAKDIKRIRRYWAKLDQPRRRHTRHGAPRGHCWKRIRR